jgi:hypothetical protein
MKILIWIFFAIVVFTSGFIVNEFVVPHTRIVRTSSYEFVKSNMNNQAIDADIRSILDTKTQPVLVRVALIHNGINLPNSGQTALFRWDTTNSISAPGFKAPEPLSNQPLSGWREYIADMMDRKCSYVDVKSMSNYDSQVRLSQFGIKSFITCPLVNQQNELLGALFVSWTVDDLSDEDISGVESYMQYIADRVVDTIETKPLQAKR